MTDSPATPDVTARPSRRVVGPPTKAQLAVMIWLAAVPIVVYGLMPQLHRLRVALLSRAGAA